MTESNSSSLIRMSSVSRVMPALATSTSTGPPKISSAAVKAASTEAESVTSHRTPCSPSGGSPERWVMTTLSPAVGEGPGDRQADAAVASGHEHVARLGR